jgi:hypothetical protein
MKELVINPSNPRSITKKDFEALRTSVNEFGKMLELRPIVYDDENVIWGGNMRYQAYKLAVQEGLLEHDEKYFKKLPSDWNIEDKRRFAIADNVNRGDWDDEILANEWDDLPLQEWGINTDSWAIHEQFERAKDVGELDEAMNTYLNGTIKQIVLYYTNEEFLNIMAKVDEVKTLNNLEDNTALFNFLLENYYENNISKEKRD